VKRTKVLAALACALLALSLVGCGSTNNLQSITLNVTAINGVAVAGQGGFVTLQGNGGTLQLQALGNYSGSKPKDLTKKVTFTVVVDPFHAVDDGDNPLLAPCAGPCPTPFDGIHGTVEYSPSGLITAVEPAVCTWLNSAIDPSTTAAWGYVGDYEVTASYAGITSQPIYIPVASATGIYDQYSNPKGNCGPSS
jgi:hypothetical protein